MQIIAAVADSTLARAKDVSLVTFEHEFSLIEYRKRDFEALLEDIETFRQTVSQIADRVLHHVALNAVAARVLATPRPELQALEDRLRQQKNTSPRPFLSSPPREPIPQDSDAPKQHSKDNLDQ